MDAAASAGMRSFFMGASVVVYAISFWGSTYNQGSLTQCTVCRISFVITFPVRTFKQKTTKAWRCAIFFASVVAFAQSGNSTTKQITVSGDGQWTDSGVSLAAGDTVTIEATGTLTYQADKEAGPDGMQ